MARATVYIDEAVLPPSEAGKLDRGALAPKYFAAYRLPGSQSTETTPAVAALDDGQRGRLAQLGYCGIHWVSSQHISSPMTKSQIAGAGVQPIVCPTR